MSDGHLHPQFESLARQTDAARLGMWIFLASELLLFSALFALYAAIRVEHPAGFAAGVRAVSQPLGAGMTAVLITSSLTVALAFHVVREGRPRAGIGWLAASLALAFGFLVLKGIEYSEHWRHGLRWGASFAGAGDPGGERMFFSLYYAMTGLHALHVMGGIGALGGCALALRRRRIDARWSTPLELSALYWHLVDGIWLFLWACFYLIH